MYRPDRGPIRIKGEPVQFQDTMDALRSGISIIHQELNLVPYMTVAENIWLGREPMKYCFVDHGKLNKQTQTLLNQLNIRLRADRLVGELSIAAQQIVVIAKAVSWNADIVIMDEPNSALTESEVAHLFTIIRDLLAQGKAIIYISHKLDEIFAITDEISIFRDGSCVGSNHTAQFTRQSLITQMVGRELTQLFPKFNNTIGEEVLTVRNLTSIHDVSFTLRRGEILGVAGLVGAGRSEMMESLFGMESFENGEVLIHGVPVKIDSPSTAIEKRMAFLTEDRKKSGLFLVLSVMENMSIVNMPEYSGKSCFVSHLKMAQDCMEQIRRLNIKTPTMDQSAVSMSAQKQKFTVLSLNWLTVALPSSWCRRNCRKYSA